MIVLPGPHDARPEGAHASAGGRVDRAGQRELEHVCVQQGGNTMKRTTATGGDAAETTARPAEFALKAAPTSAEVRYAPVLGARQERGTAMSRFTQNRRAPRQPGGWFAKFQLDDVWHPCIVHDVSVGGIGLEVHDVELTVGDEIIIDLQVPKAGIGSLVLVGEVRYVLAGAEAASRTGIKFVRLTEEQQAVLNLLVGRQSGRQRVTVDT